MGSCRIGIINTVKIIRNPPSENEMNSIKQKALERYKSTKEYVEFHDHFKDLDTRGWFDKKIKKRLLLQAGRANKTYFDRSGTISY